MAAEPAGAAVAVAATERGQVAWLPMQPGSQLGFQTPVVGRCCRQMSGVGQPGGAILDMCFTGARPAQSMARRSNCALAYCCRLSITHLRYAVCGHQQSVLAKLRSETGRVPLHAGQYLAVLLDTGQQELQLRAVEGEELLLVHLVLVSMPPYFSLGGQWAMQWRQLLAAPWPDGGGHLAGWNGSCILHPRL